MNISTTISGSHQGRTALTTPTTPDDAYGSTETHAGVAADAVTASKTS
jgi:hypothetical protein